MATEENKTNGTNFVVTGKTKIVELAEIVKELEDKKERIKEDRKLIESDRESLLNLENEVSEKVGALIEEEDSLKKIKNDLENEKLAFKSQKEMILSSGGNTPEIKDEISKQLSILESKQKETQAKNIELDNRKAEIEKTEKQLIEKETANQKRIAEIEKKWLDIQKSQERVFAAIDEAKELLKYKKSNEHLKATHELLKEKVKEEYKKYSKGALEKREDEGKIYRNIPEANEVQIKSEGRNYFGNIDKISESINNNDFESASREIESIAKNKNKTRENINEA